ncbi:MAG: restriction endonuclease subunit S [Opitutae bacterium]|nr:restriction endonuclease subunit S [Opitutae bacterium]
MTRPTATPRDAQPALTPKLRFPEFRDAPGWTPKPLEACLDYEQPTPYLVSDTNYSDSFKTPVLTAGKTFILGYTNEQHGIFKDGLPVIIFDDFTTATQFVDFPFKAKSSAMKILKAKAGANIKFMYERLQTLSFEVGAHERHWISEFAPMLVSVPSPTEQQKIAECLSTLDELIGAESQKLDALKAHKKGLMQQLFPREGETIPRLRFPEFHSAPEWEEKTLGEIVEVASGQIDPKEQPYCDFPQIGSENIESDSGKVVNVKSAREKGVISGNYVFDGNDVLYSKIRPALNKVAAPNFKGICSADIYPIRPASGGLLRSYLLFLLLSETFLDYAIRSSDRGKIPKINRDALLTYKTQIPKPDEQRRIATCLSSLDDLIAAQSDQLAALQNHKQGLLQQLFPSPADTNA